MANVSYIDLTTAPAGAGFDDNADQTTCGIFTTGTTRDILGVAFYLSEVDGAPTIDRQVALWVNGNNTIVSGTKTLQVGTHQGWNLVPFVGGPVEVSSGTQYIAGYESPAAETDKNALWSDSGGFASAITLNDMTGVADADDDEAIGNGRFQEVLPIEYPTTTFGQNNYMVVPYYDDGAAGPVIARRRQLTTVRL